MSTNTAITYEILNHKNPIYDENIADWILYKDSRSGKGGFKDGGYLQPHPRESEIAKGQAQSKFDHRKANSTYMNLIKPILTKAVGYIFRQPILRSGSDKYMKWLETCGGTKAGNPISITDIMQEVALEGFTFSVVYTVLDTTVGPTQEGANRAEVNSETFPPYLTNYTPIDLWDFSESQEGDLAEAKFHVKRVTSDVMKGESTEEDWFYIWQEEVGHVYKVTKSEDGKEDWIVTPVITDQEHGHKNGPPIAITDFNFSLTPYETTPFLDSISQLSVDLYNMRSEARAYYRNVLAFPLLLFPTPSPDMAKEYLKIGARDILFYPEDATNKPEILGGDVKILEQYRTDIKELIVHMGILASQRLMQQISEQPRSGESLKQDFGETQSFLAHVAQRCERSEIQFAALWEEATKEEANYEVKYPRSFDIDTITADIDTLFATLESSVIEGIKDEAQRQIIKRISGGDLAKERELEKLLEAKKPEEIPLTAKDKKLKDEA